MHGACSALSAESLGPSHAQIRHVLRSCLALLLLPRAASERLVGKLDRCLMAKDVSKSFHKGVSESFVADSLAAPASCCGSIRFRLKNMGIVSQTW